MLAGIYVIAGCAYLPSSHGDNAYLGKAEDIPARFQKHQDDLRAGRHHNRHLQNYHRKNGVEALRYVAISELTRDALDEEAKKAIAENFPYTHPKAFNFTPGDGSVTHTLEYAFENRDTGERALGDDILASGRLRPELNMDRMYHVHRGLQEEHRGWRKIAEENQVNQVAEPSRPEQPGRILSASRIFAAPFWSGNSTTNTK